MVTVSISETYDLHTVVNKMTLIAIHTPKKELIKKTYPGLCMNCKYFRIKSVDVSLSTAQQLPLGVDQIGLDTGKIRPQDIMNPILYKAVSNDSWSTLEARLQTLGISGATPSVQGSMAIAENDEVTGIADEHQVYYSLLSNRDGFKVAHPQQGLTMKHLVPLVFDRWYNVGENYSGVYGDVEPPVPMYDSDANSLKMANLTLSSLRGRPHPMPRMNTTYLTAITSGSGGLVANGMGSDGTPYNFQTEMPDVPPVMLGAIILPPVTADTGILYYRMVCRTYIEFTDVRPIQEITSFSHMNTYYGPQVYHSDYDQQSKNMDATTDMVDIKNGEIEKIMEGK